MPFVPPAVLAACAELLAEQASCDIATVVAPESSPADRANPDVVKAVLAMGATGRRGRALYFTRSTLYGDGPVWRHVGIYGYRRDGAGAVQRRAALAAGTAREAGAAARAGAGPVDLGRDRGRRADLGGYARRPGGRPRPCRQPRRRLELYERPTPDRLPGRAWAPTATRPAAPTFPTTSRSPHADLRGRVRGGEVRRLRAGHDPGGELHRRPGRRRAPPAAASGLKIIGERFKPIRFQLMANPGVAAGGRHDRHQHADRRSASAASAAAPGRDDRAGRRHRRRRQGPRRTPRPHRAAIAPALAAELYGLEILLRDIEDEAHNTTRFLVMTARPRSAARRRPARTA